MKVGTIVYATKSGLGILAKDFYDNGIITDVLVQSHGRLKDNLDWYAESDVLPPRQNIATNSSQVLKEKKDLINSFIDKVDILLLFEIEWYSDIIQEARKRGKKVVLMPMYECSPYPIDADCYITTSDLDHDYYVQMYPNKRIERVNVPSNSNLKWKLREKANLFIHNAGNGSFLDRNGTQKLLDAVPYIKNKNIKIKIRTQVLKYDCDDYRVQIDNENLDFKDVWSEGDVFIFPERWNGLSLPMQEAFSSGMPVLCGNRHPMNTWLPKDLMVDPVNYTNLSIVNVQFQAANYSPLDIARKIDEIAETDITKYSLAGKLWGENNSWKKLKPKYAKILEEIINE